MSHLFFWKDWNKTEKYSFFTFLTILLFSLLFFLFSWQKGLENIINWDILSELDEIPTTINTFSTDQLSLNVHSNAYIVKERFLASPMVVNSLASRLFLGLFIAGLALLLASFTKFSRYWFLGGMTALAAIFITFRFENVFQTTNQAPFLWFFIPTVAVAFYLNNYAKAISMVARYRIFLLLVLVLGAIVYYFSKIPNPEISLASYVMLSAILLTLIFIVLVSHEIMAGLVWVVTKSAMKGNNLTNQYFIVSTIFLLNVLLIFLEKNRFIEWHLLPISPFILHFISLIIGIWGFRKYCEQSGFFNYKTAGSALFIGLAIVSTTTIAYAFATYNDPLIETFESIIITAQLCIGIAFFLYTLANFIQPLQQGLSVHRVLYQPKFLELALFRLGGVFLMVALLSLTNNAPYNQARAGYFNAIADYHYQINDLPTAEVFYKEATHTDIHNHKSNYALASLAMKVGNRNDAGFFLKNATKRLPSTQSFVGLSQVLQENDMFFDALFTLKEGEKVFPKNQQILNNLAYLYEKAKVLDSTKIYLAKAKENCQKCEVAESNLLAFGLKYSDKGLIDNSFESNKGKDYRSFLANHAAYMLGKKMPTNSTKTELSLPKDSLLDVSTFALIYNESQNPSNQFPFSAKAIQKIQQKAGNEDFIYDLMYARACQNYYHENKIEGMKQLSVLASDSSQKQTMYRQNIATWFLQNGVYQKGIEWLQKANDTASVNALEKQNFKAYIADFQQKQANDLLKQGTIEEAYRQAPLNPIVLKSLVDFYNQQKQEKKGYDAAFEAIELNKESAELWKIYALQSLKIGMKDYAEEALLNVELMIPSTDYQTFLSTYQAQKALMEKNAQGFE